MAHISQTRSLDIFNRAIQSYSYFNVAVDANDIVIEWGVHYNSFRDSQW